MMEEAMMEEAIASAELTEAFEAPNKDRKALTDLAKYKLRKRRN